MSSVQRITLDSIDSMKMRCPKCRDTALYRHEDHARCPGCAGAWIPRGHAENLISGQPARGRGDGDAARVHPTASSTLLSTGTPGVWLSSDRQFAWVESGSDAHRSVGQILMSRPGRLRRLVWCDLWPLATLLPVWSLLAGGALALGAGSLVTAAGVATIGLVAVIAAAPLLLRALLFVVGATRSVSIESDLRSEIASVANRCGFQVIEIASLRSLQVNAFSYRTLTGRVRIIVSSSLIETLSPDEFRAVLLHECGHLRRMESVLLTPWTLAVVALEVVRHKSIGVLGWRLSWPIRVATGLFSVSIRTLLRPGSHARELEADRYAIRHLGDPDLLIRTLVRVGHQAFRNQERPGRLGPDGFFPRYLAAAFTTPVQVETWNFDDEIGERESIALERAMAWDLGSSWSRPLYLFSSHPAPGTRIAEALWTAGRGGLASRIQFPKVEVARGIPIDLMIIVLGAFSTVLAALLMLATSELHGLAIGMVSGTWVALLSLVVLARRRGDRNRDLTTGLLYHVDAGPIRGTPCSLDGTISLDRNRSLVIEDRAGSLPIRASLPLRILARIKRVCVRDLIGQDVRIDGWYLRSPDPVVNVRAIKSPSGRLDSWVVGVALNALAGGVGIALAWLMWVLVQH